jgi:hypothetical protein
MTQIIRIPAMHEYLSPEHNTLSTNTLPSHSSADPSREVQITCPKFPVVGRQKIMPNRFLKNINRRKN